MGFARLASYLCPGQIPIGHSLTPGRLRRGYDREELPRVPMPRTRATLALTLARFAFRDKSLFFLPPLAVRTGCAAARYPAPNTPIPKSNS